MVLRDCARRIRANTCGCTRADSQTAMRATSPGAQHMARWSPPIEYGRPSEDGGCASTWRQNTAWGRAEGGAGRGGRTHLEVSRRPRRRDVGRPGAADAAPSSTSSFSRPFAFVFVVVDALVTSCFPSLPVAKRTAAAPAGESLPEGRVAGALHVPATGAGLRRAPPAALAAGAPGRAHARRTAGAPGGGAGHGDAGATGAAGHVAGDAGGRQGNRTRGPRRRERDAARSHGREGLAPEKEEEAAHDELVQREDHLGGDAGDDARIGPCLQPLSGGSGVDRPEHVPPSPVG